MSEFHRLRAYLENKGTFTEEMLASYLGVSPETLSCVRKNRSRK